MSRSMVRIDLVAREVQFVDHLAPVWHALPARARGSFVVHDPPAGSSTDGLLARAASHGIEAITALDGPDRPTLVASVGDLAAVRAMGRAEVALLEHGIGQSYAGDPDWAHRSSYPGGRGRDASLFLHPNATSAARDRAAYPEGRIEVVGCPKLDTLPAREPGPGPVIAVAFHWDGSMPEVRWAWPRFRHAVVRLASRYTVIGHGHPRAMADLAPWYRRAGIEVMADFRDVCRRADLLVFDNSSVGFEFAATGRPVVVLEGSRAPARTRGGRSRTSTTDDERGRLDGEDAVVPLVRVPVSRAPAREGWCRDLAGHAFSHHDVLTEAPWCAICRPPEEATP